MAIIQFKPSYGANAYSPNLAGGTNISRVDQTLICSDNLAAVITAGYLNQLVSLGHVFYPNDVIFITYSGGQGWFVLSINSTTGVITLAQVAGPANSLVNNGVNQMAAGGEILLDKANATIVSGAVTQNKQAGQLTTPSLTTASGSAYSFTLTNSEITVDSVIPALVQGGTNTTPGIIISAVPSAGSAVFTLQNQGVAAAALNGTVVVGYAIL